jgi:hypothetical protein
MFKPNQYLKVQAIYIALLALIWSLLAYRKGIVMSPDSRSYSRWADILIQYNFNVLKFLENVHDQIPPLFYFNWVTIAAFNKVLFGENWGLGIVTLNLLSGIFAAFLLIKTSQALTGKPACAIFAGLFLLICHDFYLWIPYVLSDILFSFLCFLIFTLTISLNQQPVQFSKKVIGLVALLCFALFFRPTWPPLLIFALLSISLAIFFNSIAADPNKRHRFIIGCTLFACVFIPAIIFCHSYLTLYPEKWPFSFMSEWVSIVATDYQQGIVIYARPETYHTPPHDLLSYALISAHKMIAFFYVSVHSYSFKHTIVNYIFFVPVYVFSLSAIVQLFKKANGPSPANWWCIFYCVLFIFLIACFHSLQQIDYDFRYRLPCILPLILLASLGLNEFINGFSKKV